MNVGGSFVFILLLMTTACSQISYLFGNGSSGNGSVKSRSSSSKSSAKPKITTTSSSSNSADLDEDPIPDTTNDNSEEVLVSDRIRFGQFNGSDFVDFLTTRKLIQTDFTNAFNCQGSALKQVTIPANFTSYVLPSGCVTIVGGTTVAASSKLLIYSGTKLINSVIKVKGSLEILGTIYRNVEFSNVDILPDGGTQEVKIRYLNMVGGSLYPQASTYGPSANLSIKLSTFRNLSVPIYIFEPSKDLPIWWSRFSDSAGIQIYNSTTNKVDIKFNIFERQTSPYALKILRSNANIFQGDNSLWIQYNSFLSSDRIAVDVASSLYRTDVLLSGNYWGYYINDSVGMSQHILGRINGETTVQTAIDMGRNCQNVNPSHCVIAGADYPSTEYMYQIWNDLVSYNYYNEPLVSKTLAPRVFSSGVHYIEKGNYDGLVNGQATVIEILEGASVYVRKGTRMSNFELRVKNGNLYFEGTSKSFIHLENVRIRALAEGQSEEASGVIRLTEVQMKGGSLYSYEPDTRPQTRLELVASVFEGLDLPIFIHNSFKDTYINLNLFIRSQGIVLGADKESWYTQMLMQNTFVESQSPFNIYVVNIPQNNEPVLGEQIYIKNNNFFSGPNVKAIYFADNFGLKFTSNTSSVATNPRILSLRKNFFADDNSGLAAALNAEIRYSTRLASAPWNLNFPTSEQPLYNFDTLSYQFNLESSYPYVFQWGVFPNSFYSGSF